MLDTDATCRCDLTAADADDADDDREHAEAVDAWELQQIRKGGSRQLSERNQSFKSSFCFGTVYGRVCNAVIGACEFVLWRSVYAVRLSGIQAQRVLGFVKSHFLT